MHLDGIDVRTVVAPADARPRIGDNLGLAFDPDSVHIFDDDTGLALR